jgi:hypothetical protein
LTGRAALIGQRKDCDPVPGSAASAKRISAERECEPVFFMTAERWFSTVRWLMNAGPAAREPHRPVADVVLAYAVKSSREALHCCDTGFFRRCFRPNQDGALLNRRVDDSLLAVVDPVESWTARQHLCACGGKSTIKTTPNPVLIAPVLYEK